MALAPPVVVDDFSRQRDWKVVTTGGATASIAVDDGALRIDFDSASPGGHVLVRRDLPLSLPPNYALHYRLRAAAPPLDFELKLIDAADANVWWYRRRATALPREWTEVRINKPRLEFAWGPAGGGAPQDIGAVEFAITALEGDRGTVWIDDLRLEERPPPPSEWPAPQASASSGDAALAVDGRPDTPWFAAAPRGDEWLQLDLGGRREYGGLWLEWGEHPDIALATPSADAYVVQASDDAATWTTVFTATHTGGGSDFVYLPDGESRFLRMTFPAGNRPFSLLEVSVLAPQVGRSPNALLTEVARRSPAGNWPRYLSDRQSYWTVAGLDGDPSEAAMNEDGLLEIERGGWSIEPFLWWSDGERLDTWDAVEKTQSLQDGWLPIPSVTWHLGGLRLTVTAFVAGEAPDGILIARYRVESTTATLPVSLILAIRPLQVLPPWQTLNMEGGFSPIHRLAIDPTVVGVNDVAGAIQILTPPTAFGVAAGDPGALIDFVRRGALPPLTEINDPLGFASGALRWDLHLAQGGSAEMLLALPYGGIGAAHALRGADAAATQAKVQALQDATAAAWRERLGTVELRVPADGADIARTVKSTLAYILINRDGAAIQPGSRTYTRAWIRDGALTSTALLEMGLPEPVREFLPWYASYQLPGGRIPCCVDRHGADPLPEHDSNGEFLYAVAEYYRYTRDVGLVHRLWPNAVGALDDLAALRGQRLTAAYVGTPFAGLLPESISHEGYAARPVHSYWDDLFAVRGLKDAVLLATVVDDQPQQVRAAALRDGLRRDLHASIARVIADRQLDYIPASVELADFDPSSTAIAFEPVGEDAALPQAALRRTFLRYAEEVAARRAGSRAWDGYAPYEFRNVGALIRLGYRDEALATLEWLLAGRRPAAWNQWAEIVWRDPAAAKFIGDMPHTWVGSGFIEAVRTMFAYEREADAALVIAAGLPRAWVEADGGTGVARLPTHYGVLSYDLFAERPDATRLRLRGVLEVPPGGLVLEPPLPRPPRRITINGQATAAPAIVRALPADVLFEY